MSSSDDPSSSSGNSTSISSPPPDSSPPSPPSPPAPAENSTAPPPENSSPDPPPATVDDTPSNADSSSSSSSSTSSPPDSPNDGPPPKSSKGSSPSKSTNSPSQPNLLPSSSSSSSSSSSNTARALTASDSSSSKSDGSVSVIVGVATAIVLVVIVLAVACVCCSKKKKRKPRHQIQYYATDVYKDSNYYGPSSEWHNGQQTDGWHPPPAPQNGMKSPNYSGPHGAVLPPPSPAIAIGFNKSTFTYEELASATNGFSQANLLGQGGFGYVHKGILPNGKEVAVKQLKSGSGQGEREFHAEVDIISRVHHRHLVSLVGYSIAGAQRMLVYEFVPNKTLEFHLHGRGLPVMDFSTRLKIALGSAKGLAYLHEDCHPRIIHRDIKAANILLDFKFEAMVADFGLAKLTTDNHTHVSTRVMGTFGYLAPEYASSGKLTEKSDVFSYGVMLLELITGRRPVDSSHTFEDSLVDWARPVLSRALADGNYDELADQRLNGNYNPMEMARVVACAAASVRHSARRRPKMSQIVRALEGDVSLEDLNEGMRPGQSMMFSSGSDYESSAYTSNMNRIRKVQMAVDPDQYSGEYSGQLSDHHYGHHHRSGSSCSDDDDLSGELDPIDELHVDQRHRPTRPL